MKVKIPAREFIEILHKVNYLGTFWPDSDLERTICNKLVEMNFIRKYSSNGGFSRNHRTVEVLQCSTEDQLAVPITIWRNLDEIEVT